MRVQAAAVNWLDWHFLHGTPYMVRFMAGLSKPRHPVLGIDFSGQVAAVGPDVTQFQPGDEVFGSTSHGCYAEYVCAAEAHTVLKPTHIRFEEAAALPAPGLPPYTPCGIPGISSLGRKS